jgi:sugar/nucleoside kinase (ribokinase family)
VIAFCGYANTDLTVRVPVLPVPGDRVQATAVHRRDGGMGANAAVAAARMGARVRFAGVVGDDPASVAFLDALADEGIDTTWTARTGRLTTAVVLLTPDGERSIISEDDAITTEHIRAVAEATSAAEGLLYVDGYRFPGAADALGGTGVTSIVDLDGCEDPDAATEALRVADHVVIGHTLGTRLFGENRFAELAVEHEVQLVVTAGARGWRLYTPGGQRHSGAAIAIDAVDVTGAGDCFTGTYCAELDRGTTPADAARFAGVAAGLSCAHPGARAGAPPRSAVLEFLRSALSTGTSTEETTCAGR